jgi:lipid-binding SYLF domain-containing protein
MKQLLRVLRTLALCSTFLIILAQPSLPQTTREEQSKRAIERSEKGAQMIELILKDAGRGVPRDLLLKAQAIAVFPHLVKVKMLFQQMTTSFGVVSRRTESGWSLPAYYTFGGVGIELNKIGGETADVVMLFMNRDAADWFQKGRFELKGKRKTVSGVVGTITDAQRDELDKANLILYVVKDGQLQGATLNSSFFAAFVVNPDNKLNKAMYGIKSSETLQGKQPAVQTFPPKVLSYQESLLKNVR